MRTLVAILLYAVVVVIGGAVLAPWLFWLIQPYAEFPFRRVFNRAVMVVALAGLWPLLRALGVRSWREVGWARSLQWGRHLLWGFLVGVVSLTALAVARSREVDWHRKLPQLPGRVVRYAATAAAVAVIEETFFRGGLQRALRQSWRPTAAVAVASVIYAALHFLKPDRVEIASVAVTWWSGFVCLASVFSGTAGQPDWLVAFGMLFLVGWILGWAFEWTRMLYLPIGLHAGWVLPNELCQWLKAGRPVRDPWAWPVLLVVFVAVAWWSRCRTQQQQ